VRDARQPSDRADRAATLGALPCPDEVEIELELPPDPAFDAVARLVAAGVGARAGLGVDRIEDLQLALEAVRRTPQALGRTTMTFTPATEAVLVDVGPLGSDGDGALERVLSTLVGDVYSHGADEERRLVLRVVNPPAHEGR
jgi:hypothetical protein